MVISFSRKAAKLAKGIYRKYSDNDSLCALASLREANYFHVTSKFAYIMLAPLYIGIA
jgi:hypothetical protein